ncbi:MAG: GAF domain-containing protein, partial [Planctomycetota bacterium]|nr:GAF domain-containing protein [Planctomycetota bacterium]
MSVSSEALAVLGRISSTLSAHAGLTETLDATLLELVVGLDCEAGWIVLVDPRNDDPHAGRGFTLAAHCGLPQGLCTDREEVWGFTCCCEAMLRSGRMEEATNELECARLDGLRREHGDAIAHASAPLRWQGRDLGVLNLVKSDWSCFDVAELEVMMRAAQLIAAAIGRTQLYERMQRRIDQEHKALLELSRELLERRDATDLMQHLVRAVCRLTDADACALLLPDNAGAHLRFEACTGWRTEPCRHRQMLACDDRCSPWEAMQRRQPLAVPDLEGSEIESWAAPWVAREGFRAQAVVPLVAGDDAIGVLVIHKRTPRRWKRSAMQFLHVMANQAAVALDTALLREGVRARRRIDEELAVA